ncbi:MRP-L47-domain-containing protein [Neolentinus lepideus HHB14362 ss-1]|uniref:Large ribosomal subunit protein uL29m n=1 Tax=Neolentinus lepideus HHB14362 ss-1 TaxID=1314782 RepID=A0A165MQ43_9AGAM|nr:MRP-L47-domain-containing protein [Neolentinus lepideus HHB14362 ss-1]
MLALYRTARGCLHARSFLSSSSRTFAAVVETVTTSEAAPPPPLPIAATSESSTPTTTPSVRNGRKIKRASEGAGWKHTEGGPLRPHLGVQVDPNHGLYAFFRKKVATDGSVTYETLEAADLSGDPSGRSWTAAELRRKSFRDLHTLWYVLLRERNLLATQKEEARRIGANHASNIAYPRKLITVRKSMARIKYVLNERRLAYLSALEIQNRIIKKHVDLQTRHAEIRAYSRTKWREHASVIEERKRKEAEEQARREAASASRARKVMEDVKAAVGGIFGEEINAEVEPEEVKTQEKNVDAEAKRIEEKEKKGEEKKREKVELKEDKKPQMPPVPPPEEKQLGDRVAAEFFGFDADEEKKKR